MRKKLLMVFGFASALAISVALATDKAAAGAAGVEPGQDAKQAAIQVEGKAYDCRKAESHCLKQSGAAKALPSDDQNAAGSGMDCPRTADCPKADCDKSMCLKSHGKAKAGSLEKAGDKSRVATEI